MRTPQPAGCSAAVHLSLNARKAVVEVMTERERAKDRLIGGGETDGDGNVPYANSKLRPTILYKEKANYTEEARQNRVQGVVVLSVMFGADGRIHDLII